MKTLTIYGASDDLVECSGIPGADEFNIITDRVHKGHIEINADGIELRVDVLYSGGWSFAIQPQDGECDVMPDWKVTREWGTEVRYSEFVTIELPDDAKMFWHPIKR